MAGSTLGHIFCVTNFGESHGPAIGCVVDGCPPGLKLEPADIQKELDRRKPGTSRHVTQRREPDEVEILSGMYEGVTTGTPICLLIRNKDQRSKDYDKIAEQFRPGHADFGYWHKYGVRDPRGGGRSSARLTAPMVAAGAVARKWLFEEYGTTFRGCMTQLGEVQIEMEDWEQVYQNPFFIPNRKQVAELEAYMDGLRRDGDSIGAKVFVEAQNVPVGLGEPLFDKLDADIAKVMMGLNAVKGVEIGDGFACVAQRGSEHGDEMDKTGFLSNHAGGIAGGVSTGQDITVRLAIKPASSIRVPKRTLDVAGNEVFVETHGRHDPCVGIRAMPVAEALLATVIMDHVLRQRGQCGNVVLKSPLFTG